MFFNRKIVAACLFGTIAIASCAPALYQPVPADATSGVTHEELQQGRSLYVSSCGSCHSLYLPQHFTGEIWKKNLDEMQERAKINDQEKTLILAYLKAGSKK